ncbi:DUF2637 domain-containing protein [Streptomonospora salina]|uniref:DUF2637 domain-containing protein n=1 Tax=Streptomonospora salina TaxID=104205 RepID=A0A841E7C1_9ACTN|nr:DUF2637 domain-containing protein [Streptomonospora salina]MBB5998752.1 hypothetical protein [Streptomonospora salina]
MGAKSLDKNGGRLRADRLIRESTKLVVCGVSAVAAVVSYRHAYAVVTQYGESGLTAWMIPLTIDGLVYASSMVILDAARHNLRAPVLAWCLLWVGILATLAANVAHGIQNGVVGAVVAAWPAIALVGCYEMMMWLVRARSEGSPEAQASLDVDERAAEVYRTSLADGQRLSERRLAEMFSTPQTPRSRRWARKIIKEVDAEDGE